MPMLVCAAQNCVYNQAMYCSKGDIMVGGEQATTCQETCCESFRDRREGTATSSSSMGAPTQCIYVDCKATHCRYNEDCKCHAEEISISGAGAVNHDQTECVTFTAEK